MKSFQKVSQMFYYISSSFILLDFCILPSILFFVFFFFFKFIPTHFKILVPGDCGFLVYCVV